MEPIGKAMSKLLAVSCLLWTICACAAWGQKPRDEWKQPNSASLLRSALAYSLANAPLSASERNQVYQVVDDKTIHDSFTPDERDDERETVLSSPVGFVRLADAGPEQVLVRGPVRFCGASGNCSIWIFARESRGLRLILGAGGNSLFVSPASSRGFHDLATAWHNSGFEEGVVAYRWNGRTYAESDCYNVRFDVDNRQKPPVIQDCPPR